MIYTGLDNFYLTDEQLAELPSVKEGGLEAATEFNLRVYGATLIQEGGLLLKSYGPSHTLPSLTCDMGVLAVLDSAVEDEVVPLPPLESLQQIGGCGALE
jgi:hypothetical protein